MIKWTRIKPINLITWYVFFVQSIMSTEGVYEGEEPVLQVLAIKSLDISGESGRIRLVLSDSKYFLSFTMLAPQLNDLVTNGELSEHAIVRIKDYQSVKFGSIIGETSNKYVFNRFVFCFICFIYLFNFFLCCYCYCFANRLLLYISLLEVVQSGDEVAMKVGDPKQLSFPVKINKSFAVNARTSRLPFNRAVISLSTGYLEKMMMNNQRPDAQEPILQILGTKKFNRDGGSERYRLLLSDGKYMQGFSVLTAHLSGTLDNRDISDYTVIRVKNYDTVDLHNTVGKRILVIINLEVLYRGEDVGRRIGNPVHL